MATSSQAYTHEASLRKLFATDGIGLQQKDPDVSPMVGMVPASHPRGSVAAWATRALDEKPGGETRSVARTGAWWLRRGHR